MTVGDAYRAAMAMTDALAELAPVVASRNASQCQNAGDEDGFLFWNKVCAFITHIRAQAGRAGQGTQS